MLRKQSVIIERMNLLGCLPVFEIWKATFSILEGPLQSMKAAPNQVEGHFFLWKAPFSVWKTPQSSEAPQSTEGPLLESGRPPNQ